MGFLDKLFRTKSRADSPSQLATRHFDFVKADWKRRSSEELSNIKTWLSEASISSSSAPVMNLAVNCLVHHQWDKAAGWFEVAIDRGDKQALAELGALCTRGLGVAKDEKLGASLIARADGVLSGILLNHPSEFVASLAGKQLQKIQVKRNIWDENDIDTWEFFGCPCGERFWVAIDPVDIAEEPAWSFPQWIALGNPPPDSPYEGCIEQQATCSAYFNLGEYQRRHDQLQGKFKNASDRLSEMKGLATRLSVLRPEYRLSEIPDPEDNIMYNDMFGWVRIGGQQHKFHLHIGTTTRGDVLGMHVQVASEWRDPFRRLEAANAELYRRTNGVMAVARMGGSRPYATFAVSCAYGDSGISDSKLIAIDQLIRYFVPLLTRFFEEESQSNASRVERAVRLVEAELDSAEIRTIFAQLDPPHDFS
jgi:hypothetical protein